MPTLRDVMTARPREKWSGAVRVDHVDVEYLSSAPLVIENNLALNVWPTETILAMWAPIELDTEVVTTQEDEKFTTIRRLHDIGTKEPWLVQVVQPPMKPLSQAEWDSLL
jgi:signal transduction histidine kinase